MRILHTSDWHLGASEEQISLERDQMHFIDEICDIIRSRQIEVVIIAGDIYDRANAGGNIDALYGKAMTKLCNETGVKVVEIAGNHDNSLRLASCRDLLSMAGVHVVGSLEREPQYVAIGDAQIFMLPWITEDSVRSIFPEDREQISSLTDAYRVVTDHWKKAFIPNMRHIITAHAFITNAETSTSDRAAEIGFATQVSASVFDGFDYVALGHIHKPQDVNSFIRYCGTPMPYSFGKEEEQVKSVTIIDTEDMSHEIVELKLLHKRKTITGTLDEVLHAEYPESIQDAYVRIEITDQYVGLETLSVLRGMFKNCIYVAGKTFENEDSTISMTMEEFERMESNPEEIFKQYCREIAGEEANDHMLSLFRQAVKMVQEDEE